MLKKSFVEECEDYELEFIEEIMYEESLESSLSIYVGLSSNLLIFIEGIFIFYHFLICYLNSLFIPLNLFFIELFKKFSLSS